MLPKACQSRLPCHGSIRSEAWLTRMMRNTLRAAATDAWIFLTLPGSPALMNMQAYCNPRPSVNSTWSVGPDLVLAAHSEAAHTSLSTHDTHRGLCAGCSAGVRQCKAAATHVTANPAVETPFTASRQRCAYLYQGCELIFAVRLHQEAVGGLHHPVRKAVCGCVTGIPRVSAALPTLSCAFTSEPFITPSRR